MSQSNNSAIIEEASEYAEEWTGTVLGEQLRYALENNDLEQLRRLVVEVRQLAYDQHFIKEPNIQLKEEAMMEDIF